MGVRRTSDGVVGYAGLATCGRVWLCPVCNAKIMAARSLEVGLTLAWAESQGLQLVWGSLTLHHTYESELDELFRIQTDAWRRVVNSMSWRNKDATKRVAHVHKKSCGISDGKTCERVYDQIDTGDNGRVGYIRATELNIGPNGWHPHFHPLILVRGSTSEAEAIARNTVDLWTDRVRAAGGRADHNDAQQLRVVEADSIYRELSGYITKATYDRSALAFELLWSQGKVGRGRPRETLSHWSLLVGIAQGLADHVERWEELEAATPGRRMVVWSRGLRDFAGVGLERTDEDLAAEEVGSDNDTVCFITADGWRRIRDEPAIQAKLLGVLEHGGWVGLRIVLDAFGIEYENVSPD